MTGRLLLTTLLAGVSAPAFAQATAQPGDAAGAAASPSEAEIIVTAQKIEQRALDVPITISVNTGEKLRELGVSELDELSNYVPGLNVQEQSANNPGIVIRGITSDSGSAQQAARVTLYYNGVDISRSRGSYQDLYDVDRIEVIKGPQATLFGTASTVGAVSIISARPRAGTSAEVTGGYGNYNAYLASGFVNAGSDTLAVRIAGAFKKRDGYVRNLAPNQDDLNGQNQLGLRASVRWQPTDRLTVDAIGTYDRQRNPGTAFISKKFATPAGPGDPFGVAFLGGAPADQSAAILGLNKLGLRRHVYDGNLTIAYDLRDDLTLTLVNGYRRFDSNEVFDADGSAAPFLEFAEDARGYQINQETRFSYVRDRARASFGFNYFHEDSTQAVPFVTEEGVYLQCAAGLVPGLPCVAADGSVSATRATALLTRGAATVLPYNSLFRNGGINDSYSLFGDVTVIPTERLELTAGLRALIEQRRSTYFARQPNSVITRRPLLPVVDTAGQTFETKRSYQAFLPRFNALYRFTDRVNGFATISKGRRSPTVQLGSASTAAGPIASVQDIPEEVLVNYEVGLKGSAGPASGTIGVFYQTYDNFQVSVTENGRAVTRNAGSASNFGVELEAQVRPVSWFNIFGNFAYLDGGIDNKAVNGRFAGNRFRLQPRYQASGGVTLDRQIGSVRVFATPSVTYRSRIFFEVPNLPNISQAGVTLVNLRAGLGFGNRFEVAGFARNLTNKKYLLDAGNTGGAFGDPTFIPAEPRFYGVQLTAHY